MAFLDDPSSTGLLSRFLLLSTASTCAAGTDEVEATATPAAAASYSQTRLSSACEKAGEKKERGKRATHPLALGLEPALLPLDAREGVLEVGERRVLAREDEPRFEEVFGVVEPLLATAVLVDLLRVLDGAVAPA